jgi:hypothetical protein
MSELIKGDTEEEQNEKEPSSGFKRSCSDAEDAQESSNFNMTKKRTPNI